MHSTHPYNKIPESEAFIPSRPSERRESIDEVINFPKQQRKRFTWATTLCALLAAAILGYLTSSLTAYLQTLKIKTPLHCGSSAPEARALNCDFDLLAGGWVPRPCLDTTTLTEYKTWILSSSRHRSPFPYFADAAGTTRIADLDALSRHVGNVYTTNEEHLGHCAMQAKRVHRAAVLAERERMSRIPVGVISVNHTVHCAEMLVDHVQGGTMMKGGMGFLGTQFEVEFYTC